MPSGIISVFYFLLHKTSTQTAMSIGNTAAVPIPIPSLSPAAAAAAPASVGPAVQPTSPANASKENTSVPPLTYRLAVRLTVPGQNIPTEKPHKPQPISASTGLGERAIKR